uniref:Olfactory receptor family 3 subfamily A member 2 n=1 Tax=Rhinopithecus bieti TaxID=61621 RepID=A0A2K6N381_RHIBE
MSLQELMEPEAGTNRTAVAEFILLGLVQTEEMQSCGSLSLPLCYLVTLGATSDPGSCLVEPNSTPHVFFLGNLSVWMSDVSLSLFLQSRTRMIRQVERMLVAASWNCAFTNLFRLSCSSTQFNELLLFAVGFIMAGAPLVLIITSYSHVAAAVLGIHSVEGRKKAFSTCGSHLTVVCLFYGTGIFNYMRLGSEEASDKDKGVGVFNTVINPSLNPLIYSLRNSDVQGALWRIFLGRRSLT